MGFKSISIVLFGLALCCFVQGTAADFCLLKFWANPVIPTYYGHRPWVGNFSSPFSGWYVKDNYNYTLSLVFVKAVEKASSYCDYCKLTIFEETTFNGTNQVIDFRTRVGDNSQVTWDFYGNSYTLQCFPPQPEEEEEEEEYSEEIEVPEEEEIEEEDGSEEYRDAIFQLMNEGDGETLPHWLVEGRHETFQEAIDKLVAKRILPQGKYTIVRVYSTEVANNRQNFYRFNVQIRDESGVEFRIWFSAICYVEDFPVYLLFDAGYKENRIGEFSNTDFKELLPVDSQPQYPAEVEDLRTKSIDQAVGRLQAKRILPQATYTTFETTTIEYSAIVNMTEYPDHDDMLYRFNARVVTAEGTLFRIFAIIATNYETPEYYELIDFGIKQSRLVEFTDTDFQEFNQGEPLPSDSDVAKMRNVSVAQAIPKLQADGLLPKGQYSLVSTFTTELSEIFTNPNIPYKNEDLLYRFNVQLSNEAGAKFRVNVVVLTNWNVQPKYELIDYFFVENRFDEFTNTKFVSLDQGNLQTESINEAVDRLVSKNVLPSGEYTIAKNYPTEFSSKFEHPDYANDQYLLFNFTAQVKNAAKAEYKVYAIVIAEYDDLQDYELIDYGKLNA